MDASQYIRFSFGSEVGAMIYRLKHVFNVALRRTQGSEITVSPEDTFIVSYPKSGNTWVRFLVGNVLYPDEQTTFVNMENRIPDIYSNMDRELSRFPSPRILKSHEPFDHRYRKVIYIVRDPRDIAVSYYHFLIKYGHIDETWPMEKHVSSFAAGDLDGYGTWHENVGSWLGARRGNQKFLLLRYEDILYSPVEELRKVAHFLSTEVTEDSLHKAVELSSADQMRDLEKERPNKKGRKDKLFVRSAASGNWKNVLPESSVRLIEERWGGLMRELGYLP